jgi:hypothetical protein
VVYVGVQLYLLINPFRPTEPGEGGGLGGSNGDDDETCVQAPIIPAEGSVNHVYSKHYPGGAENVPGSATFFEDHDLYDLLDEAELVPPEENGGNCCRHVDAGQPVGTPLNSRVHTPVFTGYTSRSGVLVTAFSGEG